MPIYDQLPEGTRPITEVDHATVRKGEWASAEYPHVSMTFGDYWVAGTIRTPEEVILEAFPDRLLPADLQTWWASTKCNDFLSGVHFADPSTMTVLKNDLSPHQECTAMEKEIDRQMIELFLAKPQVYLDEEGILYLKTAQGAVAFKPKSQ